MYLVSEKVYARDLMSCGATDFGGGGCRARAPTLGAATALLTALLLGGCMQATSHPVWDANFTARDKQQLTNPPINGRGYHPPISVSSFNTTARKRQALYWS